MTGFNPHQVKDFVLNVGDELSLTIRLELAKVGETIAVVAEPSRVTVSPAVGTVIDRQFVANMPLNGRSLQSLIQLVPGVVLTPTGVGSGSPTGTTQFSVNGQRTTANYFMVDGVSANTGMAVSSGGFPKESGSGQAPGTTALGGTNSLVSLDALQEFRIETSTFAPEFGRTPGGQISLLTRSGTNTWHGSVSEYFRHDAMNANDWFANSRGLEKPKMRQHLFGAVLGGPVIRDRVFFFASYEGLRLRQPRTTVVGVPTAEVRAQAPVALRPYLNALPLPNGRSLEAGEAEFAASYSDRASFDVLALRLDARLTNALTGFVRVSHAPSETQGRAGSLSTVRTVRATNDAVTGGITWAESRVTGDLRVNWTRNPARQFSDLDTFGGAVVPAVSDVFLPGRKPPEAASFFFVRDASWSWGPGTRDEQRQLNVAGTLGAVVGTHQLKLGLDYRRMLPLLGGGGGSFEFPFFLAAQDLVAGRAFLYRVGKSDTRQREAVFSNLSVYAQDTWHAARRLTLTYGLRFERVPPATEATGRMPRTLLGIESDVLQNPRLAPEGTPLWRSRFGELAPRVGAAYQVSTRPGWEATLRGGMGLFYDLGSGSVATAFQDIYPFFAGRNTFDVPFPLPPEARVPPTLGVDPPVQFWLLDPNLRLPYTRQWNLAWEQAVGSKQSVTVGYVGATGRRLLLARLYNQPLAEWPTASTFLLIQRNQGESSYHGLQVQYQRRLHRGVQALASYTLSRARDNGSTDDAVLLPAGQSALREQQWAPSAFDVRHLFSAALTAEVPRLPGPGVLRALTKDWSVDLLVRAQSGFPTTPLTNQRIAGLDIFFLQRPDAVPGQPLYIDDPTVPGGRRFNPTAFAVPPIATRQGTFPRNGLRALGAWQVDLALRREFTLREPVRLQLRAELFNVLNHPNFGPPVTSITSPLFGQPTGILSQSLGGLNALYQMGGPRSGQLAVKVLF
jgi:hypothetical protein